MDIAKEAFHRLMNENSSAYHTKLQKLDAQLMVEKRVNKVSDPQLTGEAKTAMHEMVDMIVSHSSDQLGLEERMTMLNADQRAYIWRTWVTFNTQKQYETGECQCDFKPPRMFVSGGRWYGQK